MGKQRLILFWGAPKSLQMVTAAMKLKDTYSLEITADGDCSNEIKRCLLLGRKVMTNLFFLLFFNFTILYWFCHISTWIRHRYTRVPHPEASSFPIPSLWIIPVHQPQASCILHWTWTGNSFHIWYYTCFNAILPNHPTLSLSHRVQKTDLYISVSFAVSYTGLLLPSF